MITCTSCGKRAPEAGIGVKPEAVHKGDDGSTLTMLIEEEDIHPLCADCVAALANFAADIVSGAT